MSAYNLGTASGRIEIDGSAGAAGFKVVEEAANTLFNAVNQRVQSIRNMGRSMIVAGASGVAGFGAAIKAASDFETQMSGVRAVAGGTEEEFESLRQKALQLGADTSYSASEAALAIEELAKAGIPIEDILNGAAEGAVALAAAGGVSLPEAATIASNAMNQFGLGADQVTRVADILAGVANTSAADVSSLGQSLSQAGAVANLAGMSFRDTAIALGEMADAGINGSDAGTSLKTMLNNLIPTTTRQKKEFERLGLLTYDLADANKTLAKVTGVDAQGSITEVKNALAEYVENLGQGTIGTQRNADAVDNLLQQYGGLNNQFFDAQGNVKNLAGLQGTLGNALEGMTKQQKLASLELLFGADAMRASAILSLAGAEGYREFSDAVDKTSAAEVARVRLDNLSGAVEEFKGSMETAMITIGSIFLPVVTKIVQGMTKMVNAFNNLPGPVKTAIGIVIGIVSILLVLVGTLITATAGILAFVAQWYTMRIILIATGYLKAFFAAMKAGQGIMAAHSAGMLLAGKRTARLSLLTRVAGKAVMWFGRTAAAAWALATGPIGLTIAAIVALIAVGVLLYKKWEPFRNLVNQIGAALRDTFIAAWRELEPILKRAGEWLSQVGSKIASDVMPALRQAGALLRGAFGEAFQEISNAVTQDLLPALSGLGNTVQKDILPALQSLWSIIKPVAVVLGKVLVVALLVAVRAWGKFATFMIGTVYPILIKVAAFLATVFVQALVKIIGGIAKVISGIITVISGFINIVAGLISGDWSRVWEGAKQVVTGAWRIIQGLFGGAFSAILGILKSAGSKILGWFTGLFSSVDGATGGWVSRIIGFIGGLISGISGIVQAGLQYIWGMWSAIWNLFGPLVGAVFGLIAAVIKLWWTVFKGLFLLGLQQLKTVFQAGWNAIKAIVGAAIGAIIAVVRVQIAIIKAIVGAVWGAIKAVTSAQWNAIKAVISAVWGAIGGKVMAAVNTVKSVITSAWSAIKATTARIWEALKTNVIEKIQEVVEKARGIGDQVLGAMSGFGTLLVEKGRELIQGLVDGIRDKISAVTDAIGEVTSAIGSHLPGSPVKEGPLVSWNRGMAGKRLIDMLAGGLEDMSPIEKAMRSVATYVNGISMGMEPVLMAAPTAVPVVARQTPGPLSSAAARPTKTARKGRRGRPMSRLVSGTLRIGPDGRTYIEGIAQDVYDENEDHKGNRPSNPGGGRRG